MSPTKQVINTKPLRDEIITLRQENSLLKQQISTYEKLNGDEDNRKEEMKKAMIIHLSNQKMAERLKQYEQQIVNLQSDHQQHCDRLIADSNRQADFLRNELTRKESAIEQL